LREKKKEEKREGPLSFQKKGGIVSRVHEDQRKSEAVLGAREPERKEAYIEKGKKRGRGRSCATIFCRTYRLGKKGKGANSFCCAQAKKERKNLRCGMRRGEEEKRRKCFWLTSRQLGERCNSIKEK